MLKHAIFLTRFSLAVFFQRRESLVLATIYLSILRYDEYNLHTEICNVVCVYVCIYVCMCVRQYINII